MNSKRDWTFDDKPIRNFLKKMQCKIQCIKIPIDYVSMLLVKVFICLFLVL